MDASLSTVTSPKVPAKSRQEKAQRVHRMWKSFDEKRGPWALETASDQDFFLGNQWTEAQIRELGERGMAPSVINRVMPVILQEASTVTARKPQFRALPREDGDVKIAALWSDVLSYIHHISDGDLHLAQCAQDYFAMGAGYIQVFVDHIADDGRGEVKFQSLPIWDVWVDPNSRRPDIEDARAVIVSREISEDALVFMYPEKKDFIRHAAAQTSALGGNRPQANPLQVNSGIPMDYYSYYPANTDGGRIVRLFDCYERFLMPYVRIYHKYSGRVATMPEDQWAGSSPSPAFRVERFYRPRVRLTQTIGATDLLYEVVLPTSHYPIIPAYLHHTRTPFPKGDVSVVKGMQQELNKRHSINLHNAVLSGNLKWLTEDGAIANQAEYDAYGTRPGFMLKYRKGYQPPTPVYPQALPNSWYQLEADDKNNIEYALSVFSHMMGSNVDAPETYRGLLALEEAGSRKIQHKARNFHNAVRKVGLVCMDFAQALYMQPKLIRISGEDREELRDIWLNSKSIDINTGEIKTANSLSVGQYDLVVVEGSSMPTNRAALLNLYLDMFQLGIVDITEVIKKTDIVDREGLLQRMSEVAKYRQQAELLMEENKNLVGLNQTMRRQAQQLEVHLGAARGLETMRDEVRQTSSEQKLLRARMSDELKMFTRELQLAKKKVELDGRVVIAEMNIEREKQAAIAEVENARRRAVRPAGNS